jgi:hypothetical protein
MSMAIRSACSRLIGILLASLVRAGCASTPMPPAPPPKAATPEPNPLTLEFQTGPAWLMKCELAFPAEQNRPICGVDGINDAKNPMLARTGAEAKARANLAKKIRTAVKAGLVSYEAKHQVAGDSATAELQVEDTSKEIAEMTLSGVTVRDTYRSPQGWVWVLVAMDKDGFRQQVQSLQRYDEGLRKEIVERAEDSFRELDTATATKPEGATP